MKIISRLRKFFSGIHLNPWLWIVLTVCALLSVIDIIADYVEHGYSPSFMVGIICFAVFKSTILTLSVAVANNLFPSRRWLGILFRICVWLFVIGFVVLSIINGFCYFIYGFGLSRKFFKIIGQTNPQEMQEFLPGLIESVANLIFSVRSLIIVLSIVALTLIIKFLPRKIFILTVSILSCFGLIYIIWYCAVMNQSKSSHLLYARTVLSIKNVKRSSQLQAEYISKVHPLEAPETLSSDFRTSNIVFVIGESAARKHLSLYGWNLETSPVLDQMKDSLYVFTDALASSQTTADNIPRLLTFMKDSDLDREWYEFPTIVALYKKLGYTTAWISNQERSGVWNNISSALSAEADLIDYVGSEDSEDHLLTKYDEALLPPLKSFLEEKGGRKFAVVHLMGSHTEYFRRYPPDREFFNADMEISIRYPATYKRSSMKRAAQYDNSIRYTDSVVGEMIREIAYLKQPSLLVYVSDHGEDVYDSGNFCGRDKNSVEVPFVIYANRMFRENNPQLCNQLEKAQNLPLSTANIIHSLLTLSGVKYKYYDPTVDPLSDKYGCVKRYVDGEARPVRR